MHSLILQVRISVTITWQTCPLQVLCAQGVRMHLQIHKEFAIPQARKLHVAVNGYTVPQWCLISVLRDNDELAVFPAGQLPASLPAAPKEAHAQPPQLTAAAECGLAQIPQDAGAGAQSKPKGKRSRIEGAAATPGEGTAPEAAPKKRKAATPQALNAQPSGAAVAAQETAQVPQGVPDSPSGVHAHRAAALAVRFLHPVSRADLCCMCMD